MNVKSFLKLVEIQTKVASVLPFLLGTSYALYRFRAFNLKNFLLMLVSLLCIDMATTAINNFQDYKKANRKHGYGYESHNAIVKYNLKETSALAVIILLLSIAVISGFSLYLNTDFVVLILGAASFLTGVLYSFGPLSISRTPFGEIFSGSFMGLVIPFLAVYIHVFDGRLLSIGMQGGMIDIKANAFELVCIVLVSLPAAVGIANIMLANNICDIEDDFENKRYTLPVCIGKDGALLIYELLYYAGFLALAVLLVLGIAPVISVLALAALIPVYRHIKLFKAEQSKKNTFVTAVKSFVIMNSTLVITIFVAVILKM